MFLAAPGDDAVSLELTYNWISSFFYTGGRFLSAQIDAGVEAVTLLDLPPTPVPPSCHQPSTITEVFRRDHPVVPIIGCLWPSASCCPNFVQIVWWPHVGRRPSFTAVSFAA